MQVYHGQALGELARLLGEDKCTFSMLARIVKGKCTKTVTDHQRVIMCLSVRPFPVWVWAAPDAGREELEAVHKKLREEFPPEEYSYNVGLPLARVMLESDPTLCVTVALMAYHCHEAIPPKKTPGGCAALVREDETDLAAQWYSAMHKECALHEDIPLDAARAVVGDYISREAMYFWRDESGVPTAMCGVDLDEESGAYVTHVYTPPCARRKGYAGNLVYAVTNAQLDKKANSDALYRCGLCCFQRLLHADWIPAAGRTEDAGKKRMNPCLIMRDSIYGQTITTEPWD